MFSSRSRKFLVPILTLIIMLACNTLTAPTPQPAATLNALYTAAAQTLGAMATQGAVTATAQSSPTATLSIPTSTPLEFKTFTPVPPITRCDAGGFVDDITYPDGAQVGIGSSFTKTWRIRNVGTCTWTTGYSLIFISGDRLSAPKSVALAGNVAPGQSIDVSVPMAAPNQSGRFKGYWALRNSSGVIFGFGASATENIYVDVKVSGYLVTSYDLLGKACTASWSNGSQDLPCPGADKDPKGFVYVMNSPKLEDGTTQSKGLITFPEQVKDGMITGKYPAVTIVAGDHFQAWINCLYNANDCDVIFKVQYQIGKGTIQTLGQWREIYEGQYYPVNIDLSALSGQNVKIILTILANGGYHEDYALWIAPRITRLSSQPPVATNTASLTPTVTATGSATATATATFTATATSTATATATATDTPTPTSTP